MNARVPNVPAAAGVPAPQPQADRLTEWLAGRLPLDGGTLRLERIHGGQSNPSWIVRSGERAWVLRARPAPAAALPPSAHAIEREYRVLRALQDSDVPVPAVHVLCEDESVIGTAFYLMDFVPGRILRDLRLPELPLTERAACLWEANRVLAALHQFDWRSAGLEGFGRPGGFFGRQLRRWGEQYAASAREVGPIPAMERLARWLPQHVPPGAEEPVHACLTHGDYRLENLIFEPVQPKLRAVLDWELSTLGHPLGDLAYHCTAWHLPAGLLRGVGEREPLSLGLPGERAYVERYCARTKREAGEVLAHWPFYLACSLFRIAAILAGIGARARAGTAAHPQAAEIARCAEPVANTGWAIAQGRIPVPRS